jgi:hypothetical protein
MVKNNSNVTTDSVNFISISNDELTSPPNKQQILSDQSIIDVKVLPPNNPIHLLKHLSMEEKDIVIQMFNEAGYLYDIVRCSSFSFN